MSAQVMDTGNLYLKKEFIIYKQTKLHLISFSAVAPTAEKMFVNKTDAKSLPA